MNQRFERLKTQLRRDIGTRIDFLRDNSVYDTELYRLIRALPKGADLHAHADAILPIDEQVAFMADHPELVVRMDGPLPGMIRYRGEGAADPGFRTMRELLDGGATVEDFRRVWTLLGAGADTYLWDWFEGIFTRCGAICTSPKLVEDYYTRVMQYYHEMGVEHLELRCPFFGNREEALARGKAFYRALEKVRRRDPLFTLRIVACGGKNDLWDPQFDTLMDNALYVREQVKDEARGGTDLIVGIDIVNDEDRSYSLSRYEDRVRRIVGSNPGLHLTLHAGESLRGENAEIAIALRCGIERLGHGFNLYRYPNLLEEVLRRQICIEVCPISNRELGYCSDFSLHPAKGYREAGIPLVICSDDPAYQAKSVLTGDYLAVALGWDLSLDDLGALFRNSITYSFLAPSDKQALLTWWEEQWRLATR